MRTIYKINTFLLTFYVACEIFSLLSPTWKREEIADVSNHNESITIYEGFWQYCDMNVSRPGQPWYFLNCTFFETYPDIVSASIFAGGSILGLCSFLIFLIIVSCARPKYQNKWLYDTGMLVFLFSYILMNVAIAVYLWNYWKELRKNIKEDNLKLMKFVTIFYKRTFAAAFIGACAVVIGVLIIIFNMLNCFCTCINAAKKK